MIDILIRAGKDIADLEGWDDEKEEIPCFRGKKPKSEPEWVYFVRDGLIVGRAKYIDYRYTKIKENVQGEPMEGMAFIVKGLLNKPLKRIEVPKNLVIGNWRWRYRKDTPEFDGLNAAINGSFRE